MDTIRIQSVMSYENGICAQQRNMGFTRNIPQMTPTSMAAGEWLLPKNITPRILPNAPHVLTENKNMDMVNKFISTSYFPIRPPIPLPDNPAPGSNRLKTESPCPIDSDRYLLVKFRIPIGIFATFPYLVQFSSIISLTPLLSVTK